MNFFSRLSRNEPDTPDVATYKAIRAAGKTWVDKVLSNPATRPFDIPAAARKIGLSIVDRTIAFDDENEPAILMDYFLFDFKPQGKSVAETCLFAPGEFTPLEAELHQANCESRTSLFAVARVHPNEPKILLRDRLTPTAPELWLIDLALSESFRNARSQAFLYTRVVSLRGVHLTSGFSFVYDLKHESMLIDGYCRAMWSVREALRDQRRTRYFFALNRKIGQPQAYEDILRPSKS